MKNFLTRMLRAFSVYKSDANQFTDSDDQFFLKQNHLCPECKATVHYEELWKEMLVCPHCSYHFRISAKERFQFLFDKEEGYTELFQGLQPLNPIEFPDYHQKIESAQVKSGLREAASTAIGKIEGKRVVVTAMSFQFLGGSMGSVVGEKITRSILLAVEEKIPCILFAASGGARMHEGIFSLFQMAKTSHAITLLHAIKRPFIIVLTDPTTGGVTASFAMLGDVIIGEPKALIGFAGPRVIEGTIRQKLPPGFQRSEFLQEHGFLDRVTERKHMRSILAAILSSSAQRGKRGTSVSGASQTLIQSPKLRRSSWDSVQLARNINRPTCLQYVDLISSDYFEFHGDRAFGDDKALVGGICNIEGTWFTFLGHQKGRNMRENIVRNYGMPHPEGYRKAIRLVKQAEKFDRPIVTFVDTSGAYPGIASEERGISAAIAESIQIFSVARVPIITIIIGEGGSGGALGIAVSDRLYMLENSIYSVISPEGFASILLRDPTRSEEAAQLLRLTSQDLLRFDLIDGIIPEPEEGAHTDPEQTAQRIKGIILSAHEELQKKRTDTVLRERSEKLLSYGHTTSVESPSQGSIRRLIQKMGK